MSRVARGRGFMLSPGSLDHTRPMLAGDRRAAVCCIGRTSPAGVPAGSNSEVLPMTAFLLRVFAPLREPPVTLDGRRHLDLIDDGPWRQGRRQPDAGRDVLWLQHAPAGVRRWRLRAPVEERRVHVAR